METGTTSTAFNHAEAYCLMEYRSDDGLESEVIWNSRDGVTPFVIRSRDGTREMTHVNWQRDQRVPNHVPQPGDRIFVDMDRSTAARLAQQATRRDAAEIRRYGMSVKSVRAERFREYLGDGHRPHIVTVPAS